MTMVSTIHRCMYAPYTEALAIALQLFCICLLLPAICWCTISTVRISHAQDFNQPALYTIRLHRVKSMLILHFSFTCRPCNGMILQCNPKKGPLSAQLFLHTIISFMLIKARWQQHICCDLYYM